MMQTIQTENKVNIRPLMLEDLDSVMAIEASAFGLQHWSRQVFIDELNGTAGVYFAAIDRLNGQVIGYSGFWLIGEEAHIVTLAVHPDYRRQYVGEYLLINNILHSRTMGGRWLTLEVRVSNHAAQKLYEKYGFKNIGTRPRYYKDNLESALILWSDNIASPEYNQLLDERVAALEKSWHNSTI